MAFGMCRTGGHSFTYHFSTVNTIMLISDFLPSIYTVRKYRIGEDQMSTRLQIMGSRIRTARQFRRLTGEQLAEKIGIAVDSLRHIENGVRSPSFQLIERISDILDVSLDYLAGKTDSPLEHRVRKELENSGLTKEQEDAIVEFALNSIPIIKKHI